MEDLKSQASQYWFGLSQRERRLASVGGVALVIWLVFFIIVQPIMQSEQAALNQLDVSKSQYSRVEDIARDILALRKMGVTTSGTAINQPLDSLISRSAAEEKIPVKGINQQSGSLQVRVDEVSFSQLIKWFKVLEQQGVSVDSLLLERAAKPGMVKVVQLRVSGRGDDR